MLDIPKISSMASEVKDAVAISHWAGGSNGSLLTFSASIMFVSSRCCNSSGYLNAQLKKPDSCASQEALAPKFKRRVRPQSRGSITQACHTALVACATADGARRLLGTRDMLLVRPVGCCFHLY